MVEKIMTKVKEFFSTRTVAFYIALATAALTLILTIVYGACYAGTDYMSWAAFALTLIACLAFCGLAVFKQTERFAALVMGLLDFIAFLLFIDNVYMYFTTVFYGGFSASLLGNVDPAFYACTILFLITIVASNVCVYLKPAKQAVEAQPAAVEAQPAAVEEQTAKTETAEETE